LKRDVPSPKCECCGGKGFEVQALRLAEFVDSLLAVQVIDNHLEIFGENWECLCGRSGSFVTILEQLKIELVIGIKDWVTIPLLRRQVELPEFSLTSMSPRAKWVLAWKRGRLRYTHFKILLECRTHSQNPSLRGHTCTL
jgi:hypothetical protein